MSRLLLSPLQYSSDAEQLLQELNKASEEVSVQFKIKANINKSFYHSNFGPQRTDKASMLYGNFIEPYGKGSQPYKNYLRQIVSTWSSRLSSDRPTCLVTPTTNEKSDIIAAEVANKLIENLSQGLKVDDVINKLIKEICLSGFSSLFVGFNPQNKTIVWKDLNIDSICLDPQENIEDSKWCVIKSYIDYWDAAEIVKKYQADFEPTEEEIKCFSGGYKKKGVLSEEIFYKPCSRFKEGLYVLFISGKKVYSTTYMELQMKGITPSTNGFCLPIATLVQSSIDSIPYGDTFVNDLIPIQQILNKAQNAMLDIIDKSSSLKLLLPNSLKNSYDAEQDGIIFLSKDDSQVPSWLTPPVISPELKQVEESYKSELFSISGVNEILTGAAELKSGTSGEQLKMVNSLDKMKYAETFRSLEKLLSRAWSLTLSYIKTFFSVEEIMALTGMQANYCFAFINSNSNLDFKFEPFSGTAHLREAKNATLATELQAQLISPDEYKERAVTGQDKLSDQKAQEDLIDRLLVDTVNGTPFYEIDVNPEFAVGYLRTLQQLNISQDMLFAVDSLLKVYQDKTQAQFQSAEQSQAE